MSYPHETMSEAQLRAFLSGPRHAIVATVRRSGAPQISPVWFLYEAGSVHFSVQQTSAKHANLQRDPRVAICVDAGHPDARSVTFLGDVVLDASDTHVPMHRRIARRYCATDAETDAYLQRAQAVSPLVLVTLQPERVIARDYN